VSDIVLTTYREICKDVAIPKLARNRRVSNVSAHDGPVYDPETGDWPVYDPETGDWRCSLLAKFVGYFTAQENTPGLV
jgi:hypothetical protein